MIFTTVKTDPVELFATTTVMFFYHLPPKNSYCKQYDTNVVAHLKTIGILATPSNDLIIFITRFKYDLRKFYFINRVVDAWNSLPNWIVMANMCMHRCIVVILLPCDAAGAMHKHGLCRHAVCEGVSVCVSVTFVDHVKTN